MTVSRNREAEIADVFFALPLLCSLPHSSLLLFSLLVAILLQSMTIQ